MGSLCETCSTDTMELNLDRFYLRNAYYSNVGQQSNESVKNTLDPQNRSKQELKNLFSYIKNSQKEYFQDHNFTDFDEQNSKKIKLSQICNYERQKIQHVYTSYETRLDSFEQKNIQLTYLSTIFYEICRNKKVRQQIFLTNKINKHQAFILKLLCNGIQTFVAIDEKIPGEGENPKYINMTRLNEIWPYLLQKGWCKQIGSYEKAKGLSPEDVFEEITGAPAYSYSIMQNDVSKLEQLIKNALQNKYWICMTGVIDKKQIQNRQVFYVQRVQGKQYYLRSPFLDYSLKDHKKGENKPISLNITQIRQYFDFMTIGYIRDQSKLKNLRLISNKREDKIYEIKVKVQDMVNTRFSQFYSHYLNEKQQPYYKYSPVFLQLYNQKFKLISSGCSKATSGNKSSHASEQIVQKLKPGTYYLRIQVDWISQNMINEGQLLLYSQNSSIELVGNEHDEILQMIKIKQFDHEKCEQIEKEEQNIVVQLIERENDYILKIQNGDDSNIDIDIHFEKSKNIRIRGKQMNNSELRLSIEGKKSTIIQVLPQKADVPMELAPFEIFKL